MQVGGREQDSGGTEILEPTVQTPLLVLCPNVALRGFHPKPLHNNRPISCIDTAGLA